MSTQYGAVCRILQKEETQRDMIQLRESCQRAMLEAIEKGASIHDLKDLPSIGVIFGTFCMPSLLDKAKRSRSARGRCEVTHRPSFIQASKGLHDTQRESLRDSIRYEQFDL